MIGDWQDGPGDGYPLLLAAGEPQAALTDLGLVLFGHTHDVLMDVGGLGGSFDLFLGGIGLGVTDVFGNGAVEEEGVLQHRGDVVAQAFQGHIPHILAVDENTAFHRVVEPGDQLGGGGFAHAGGANQSHHHTRLAGEGDIFQHRDLVAVVETDVFESNSAIGPAHILGLRGILDGRGCVKDQSHTFRAGQRLLQTFQQVCQTGNGGVEQGKIQHESHNVFHGQLVAVSQETAEEHHQHGAGRGQEFHAGVEDGAGPQGPEHGGDLGQVFLLDPSALILFLAEGLDFVKTRQAVLELGIQFAHALLGSFEEGTDDFGEYHAGQQDQRDGAAGDQRQLPVDGEQDHQNANKSGYIGENIGDHMGVQQFEVTGVVDHTAHQITGLLVVEKAKIQTLELVVQTAAQIAHQMPGGLVGQVVAAEPEQDAEQIKSQQPQGQTDDLVQSCFIQACAHKAGHGGQKFGRGQIDNGKAQRGHDGQNVERFVTGGLLGQFP